MMRILPYFIAHLFILLLVCFPFSGGNCAEIDDSAIFVEAFNAYQQKDFLLAIEKCDQINQVFPDSPLKDVTLLLIARASLRAGDTVRAAQSTVQFSQEFPDSSLKTSVEDELKSVAERLQRGETLAPDKNLQAAARKVKADRIARERTLELKREAERAAKIKVEQERIARIKRDEERREMERLQTEKLARASIHPEVMFRTAALTFPVGEMCALPVEVINRGKNQEDFLVTVGAAAEYNATLINPDKPETALTTLRLAPGETFKGAILFRMPPGLVDGHRSKVALQVSSAKFNDISSSKEVIVTSAAPLLRAVAKFSRLNVAPGENMVYRITILNAGSLPARNLTVRLQLPPEVEYIGTSGSTAAIAESEGSFSFKIESIDVGKLAEQSLKVAVRSNATAGGEFRGQVEIFDDLLKKKELFTSRPSVIEAKVKREMP